MDVKIEEVSPVKRELSFVVKADEVDKTLSKIFKDLRREVKLKGFRKGKTPESVIKAHFREYAIREAENHLVTEHYKKALLKHEIPVVSTPEIHFDGLQEGRDFLFKAMVEVVPNLPEMSGYKGIPVKSRLIKVLDVDIDNAIEHLRNLQSKLVVTEEGYEAKEGDYLIIDYKETIGGKPLKNGKKTNVILKLGSPESSPEFDEALKGAKAGEQRHVTRIYPEEFSDKDLAGKEASFSITIKEIKRLELPEVNENFIKGFGNYETLEAFRQFVKEQIEKEREETNREWIEEQILTFLIKRFDFEVPQVWISKQAEYLLKKFQDDQKRQGQPVEEIPLNKHPQRKVFEDLAERQVKSMLLLDEIAKKEEITVEEPDLIAHFESIGKSTGIPAERVRNIYQSNQKQMESLKDELLRNKTLAYLREHAMVEWVREGEDTNEQENSLENTHEKTEKKGKIIIP